MTIYYKTSVKNFPFWGYARELANKLTDEEWEVLDTIFDDDEYHGQTEFNDYFTFHFDCVCSLLGLNEEEVLARG